MSRKAGVIATVGFLMCVALFADTTALQPARVAAIRATPGAYINERVRIDGFVTQFVETGSRSTSFFYLKDDWGAVIKVRTSAKSPSVGKRYSIEGPVGLDPRSKDLFVSEESRLELFKDTETNVQLAEGTVVSPPKPGERATDAGGVTPTPPQAQPQGDSTAARGGLAATSTTQPSTAPAVPQSRLSTYVMIGAAAVAVLALAVFLMIRTKREDVPSTDYSLSRSLQLDAPPPPEQVIEGKTIKLHAPPPNTVKLLPGWFDVVGGDDVVKQIRFYSLGGDRGAETTFGRAAGRPYAHIQLKAPTVSSRQAKVTFENGVAQLTNLASAESNPTRVNGRELSVQEMVQLSESDKVEMGEVSLLFHVGNVSSKAANA